MDSPRNSTSSEDENVCDCNECTLISSIGRTSTNLPERDVGSANDADEHKTSMLSQSNAVLPSVSKMVPKDDGSPTGKPKYKLREFVIQTEPVHFVAPHDPIKLIWEELATQQQHCVDLHEKTNERILGEFEYAKQGLADMVGRYTNDVRALEEKTQRIINNQADKLCHVDEDVKVSKNRLNNVEVRLTEIVGATNAQGSTCIQVERDSSRHQKWLEGLEERLQKMESKIACYAKADMLILTAVKEELEPVKTVLKLLLCQGIERDDDIGKINEKITHLAGAILHTNLDAQGVLSLQKELEAKVDLLTTNQSKTSTTTPPEEQQT